MAQTTLCGFLAAGIFGMLPHAAALKIKGDHDLVLMHIPYNFGHTVELVRATTPAFRAALMAKHQEGLVGGGNPVPGVSPSALRVGARMVKRIKPDYEPWGHFNPDLFETSEVTGCPLYFTPPKYWPPEKAKAYFGDKVVFSMLRDPFERVVAEFRGGFSDYGGVDPKYVDACDVNGAVKAIMSEVLNSTNPFLKLCTYVPQAEYFDGPYGIKLPIDNRRFPTSMNEAFEAHGYSERIATEDIIHISGCNDVWAGDLDAEARQLVRKVYARDFELLCKHFGYCDSTENTCIREVKTMCPEKLFTWDASLKRYLDK